MFSFRRRKINDQNEASIHEMEDIVRTLDQDGNGRIRLKDLEIALQRIDEDQKSKSERKTQVRTFRTSLLLFLSSRTYFIFVIFSFIIKT